MRTAVKNASTTHVSVSESLGKNWSGMDAGWKTGYCKLNSKSSNTTEAQEYQPSSWARPFLIPAPGMTHSSVCSSAALPGPPTQDVAFLTLLHGVSDRKFQACMVHASHSAANHTQFPADTPSVEYPHLTTEIISSVNASQLLPHTMSTQ